MKKSIRIAAALCAAVFALPVLAGCDNGGLTDEGTGSNGGTSGGDTGNAGNTGDSGNSGTSQGGTSGNDDTGDTGNTGDSGNGNTSGGNGGTSQGGTSGGDTGNVGNTGDSGNSGTSGGDSGNVAQNLFKGKTIEYIYDSQYDGEDGYWSTYYYKTSMTFATDATGKYAFENRWQNSDSEQPEEHNGVYDITYSLESVNGKNLLHIAMAGSIAEADLEAFIHNNYQGISSETKALLRERQLSMYYYYEFMDDDTVRMSTDYYAGDMTKYGGDFRSDENTSDNGVSTDLRFNSDELKLYCTKREYDSEKKYWGIPQFSGNNAFTVTMYRVDENENGDDRYVEIGLLAGNYDINGMEGKCDGTITFTQFPGEMQGLFADSYQMQNYDPDWEEFKIVSK